MCALLCRWACVSYVTLRPRLRSGVKSCFSAHKQQKSHPLHHARSLRRPRELHTPVFHLTPSSAKQLGCARRWNDLRRAVRVSGGAMLVLAPGPLSSHPLLATSTGAERGLRRRHCWYRRTLPTPVQRPALPKLPRAEKIYIYRYISDFSRPKYPPDVWNSTGGAGERSQWREEWGSARQQRSPPPLHSFFCHCLLGNVAHHSCF